VWLIGVRFVALQRNAHPRAVPPPIGDHEIATAAAIRRPALRGIPPGRKIADFKK
jgi:hypothetical protein